MFEILMASAQATSAVFLLYGAYLVLGEVFASHRTEEDAVPSAPAIAA